MNEAVVIETWIFDRKAREIEIYCWWKGLVLPIIRPVSRWEGSIKILQNKNVPR